MKLETCGRKQNLQEKSQAVHECVYIYKYIKRQGNLGILLFVFQDSRCSHRSKPEFKFETKLQNKREARHRNVYIVEDKFK